MARSVRQMHAWVAETRAEKMEKLLSEQQAKTQMTRLTETSGAPERRARVATMFEDIEEEMPEPGFQRFLVEGGAQ